MIAAEPGLAESIAGHADAAAAIAGAARRALQDGAAVSIVGCGTSEHAAMAVAALLDAAAVRQGARPGPGRRATGVRGCPRAVAGWPDDRHLARGRDPGHRGGPCRGSRWWGGYGPDHGQPDRAGRSLRRSRPLDAVARSVLVPHRGVRLADARRSRRSRRRTRALPRIRLSSPGTCVPSWGSPKQPSQSPRGSGESIASSSAAVASTA